MGFKVQKRFCDTCIYRDDCLLDLTTLEDEVRDRYKRFVSYRACHHARGNDVCCRGFWNAHKDEFEAGLAAQRSNLVEFVDVDDWMPRQKIVGPTPNDVAPQTDKMYGVMPAP